MIFWHTVRAGTGKMEVIEAYHSVEAALVDLSSSSWEESSNRWLSYLADEQTGETVAVAIFGPDHDLMVTCADGRRLTFEMPEIYRGEGAG